MKTRQISSWYRLIRPHRAGLFLVIALVMVGQTAWLIEPGVFGRVIDALVAQHQRSRSFEHLLLHLGTWLAIFVTNSVAGVTLRLSTARVSAELYTGLVTSLSQRALVAGEPTARTVAKAELSRELVQFFETRLPALIAGVMNVVGALIALYTFDVRIATACFVLVLPLGLVNRAVNRKLTPLEREAHDGRVISYEIFAGHDPDKVRAHFGTLGETQRRIAMLSSINFASLRTALLAVFVAVLYIAIDIDDFTTGHLYAIVSYLWTFVTYAEDFPQLVESGTSLADLMTRLSTDEATAP